MYLKYLKVSHRENAAASENSLEFFFLSKCDECKVLKNTTRAAHLDPMRFHV